MPDAIYLLMIKHTLEIYDKFIPPPSGMNDMTQCTRNKQQVLSRSFPKVRPIMTRACTNDFVTLCFVYISWISTSKGFKWSTIYIFPSYGNWVTVFFVFMGFSLSKSQQKLFFRIRCVSIGFQHRRMRWTYFHRVIVTRNRDTVIFGWFFKFFSYME